MLHQRDFEYSTNNQRTRQSAISNIRSLGTMVLALPSTSRSPFDIVRVTQVMSLAVLLHIVQNNDRRDEVDDLAGRQQVQIAAAVATPIPVNPVEL